MRPHTIGLATVAVAATAAAVTLLPTGTSAFVVPSLSVARAPRPRAAFSSRATRRWASPTDQEPAPEQPPSPLEQAAQQGKEQQQNVQSTRPEIDMSTGLWPTESRQLLALLGALGLGETAFLTFQKLVVGDLTALCSLGGGGLSARCGDVLNSEYASFLGVPLTLPAMLAYGAVAFLAARPLLSPEGSRERAEADLASRDPLLLLTTAMATFSAYLMWLLATQLRELCPYCLVSASLSFGMAALTWSKRIVPDATKATVYKGGSVAVTGLFAGLAYVYASARTLVATGGGGGAPGVLHAPPPITTHSDERSVRLAAELQRMDARMYGAFWCSHCYDQKQALGQEAYRRITYVECAPDGLDSQAKLCRSRKVPGYPTWEIRGELYPGEKSIEQLEAIARGEVAPPPNPLDSSGDGGAAAAATGAGKGS